MGIIAIFIGGIIGVFQAIRHNFSQNWIFLVNSCFSVYISVFLAPLAIALLDIPGLQHGYKIPLAVGSIFIVVDIVSKKISEQIYPNQDNDADLFPVFRFFSAGAGFLSGIIIAAMAIYCIIQCPLTAGFSARRSFLDASGKTLLAAVSVINFHSFQSLSEAGKKSLRDINLLPQDNVPDKPEKTDLSSASSSVPGKQPGDAAAEDKSAEKTLAPSSPEQVPNPNQELDRNRNQGQIRNQDRNQEHKTGNNTADYEAVFDSE